MSNDDKDKLQLVRERVGAFPDFPIPGILFRDIFPVLKDPHASKCLFELIIEEAKKLGPFDVVVGLESRGFIFSVVIACNLNIGFVPIRKKGKLPGEVKQVSFELEYGGDAFEIQQNSILPKQRVLIVDDLLATGGTLRAGCQLLSEMEAEVVHCLVVIELNDLKGRSKVPAPVTSIIQY